MMRLNKSKKFKESKKSFLMTMVHNAYKCRSERKAEIKTQQYLDAVEQFEKFYWKIVKVLLLGEEDS